MASLLLAIWLRYSKLHLFAGKFIESSLGVRWKNVGKFIGNSLAGVGKPQRVHHMEIIYPCIPDPDREDEGGQASSSLAVSTRWISAAKLLQSDLATLAQREGGE
ncbi:hypothetical protein BHM03_00052900 [Ensete ventricosum]|nr:hypothetical protein BHM03_00052900 [Ensete ventricosum]